MKTNTCFIIPIHPPKYDLAYNLIKSYNNLYGFNDLYCVFSSESDKIIFDNKFDIKYNFIIIPPFHGEGIINFKKIWALNYIFEKTLYSIAAVIDCDSIFIKKIDYEKEFKKILFSKTIYASLSKNEYICSSSLSFFNEEDKNKILKNIKIEDNFLYFWFNQIPIYSKNEFLKMFKYLNLSEKIYNIKWADFDFILYVYFLITQNLIFIKKINTNNITQDSYLESCALITHDKLNNLKNMNPLWLPSAANLSLLNKKEINIFKNIFLKFHLC